MGKFSVLKPVHDDKVNMTIKLSTNLMDKIKVVKKKAKDHGFDVDVNLAAERSISKLITTAEKELDQLIKDKHYMHLVKIHCKL